MGKKVLLIGIGQTGCSVAELFSNKMNKDGAVAVGIDTDEITLGAMNNALAIPMTDEGSLLSVVTLVRRSLRKSAAR